MTNYAKINENGLLEYAPKNKNGISNWINDTEMVLAEGFLPVQEKDISEDQVVVGYQVLDGYITQIIENIPEPEPEPEPHEPTREEVASIRAELYNKNVDPLMSEYNRKKLFNLFEEGEEVELLAEIEKRVAEIKENNPYPVEESIEEVPAEAVTEPVEESEVI